MILSTLGRGIPARRVAAVETEREEPRPKARSDAFSSSPGGGATRGLHATWTD